MTNSQNTNKKPNPWGENVSTPSETPSQGSTPSPRMEEVNLTPENERILKQALGFDPDDPGLSVSATIVDNTSDTANTHTQGAELLMELMDVLAQGVPRAAGVTAAETPKTRDTFPIIRNILGEIGAEVHLSILKHGLFKSAHEGYAVIKEELDELWDEIKCNEGYSFGARMEALQVAATALKYVMLVDEHTAKHTKKDAPPPSLPYD